LSCLRASKLHSLRHQIQQNKRTRRLRNTILNRRAPPSCEDGEGEAKQRFLITAVKAAVVAVETPTPMAETFPCFGSTDNLTSPFFFPEANLSNNYQN
ncbi:unnamed protein product, partial [Brassica oleracea var. botrytis]